MIGEYPPLILRDLARRDIQIEMQADDQRILKENTVDFVSLS